MAEENFIPHNNIELYEKMISEQFTGQMTLGEVWLVWKLPNGIIVKISFDPLHPETYLGTSYCPNGKLEIPLTHWHPYIEEVYRDLSEINSGQIFWVKKKRKLSRLICPDYPIIMFKNEWEKFSEKKKSRYVMF